jgi:hypothetical protein
LAGQSGGIFVRDWVVGSANKPAIAGRLAIIVFGDNADGALDEADIEYIFCARSLVLVDDGAVC